MALDSKATLLRAVGTIDQSVGRAIDQRHADALAITDVDGCTIGVGQRDTIQFEGHLVGTIHPERAISRCTTQHIGNLAQVVTREIISLRDGHMCAIGHDIDILSDVASHSNLSSRAVIVDIHHVVGHWCFIEIHLVNLVEIEHLI